MIKPKGHVLLFILLAVLNLTGIVFLRFKSLDFMELKEKVEFQDKLVSGGYSEDFWGKQAKIENILPNDEKVLEFISSLNNLSRNFDKLLLKFESDEPVITTSPKSLPFILEISGSPEEVFSLLDKVIRSTNPVEVINISAETKDSFINKTSLILRARLYVAENYNQ